MSYIKHEWETGQKVTAIKLNEMEDGIYRADQNLPTPSSSNGDSSIHIAKNYTKGRTIAPSQTVTNNTGEWGGVELNNVNLSVWGETTKVIIDLTIDGSLTTWLFETDVISNAGTFYNDWHLYSSNSKLYVYMPAVTATLAIYEAVVDYEYDVAEDYDIAINAYTALGYTTLEKFDVGAVLEKYALKKEIRGILKFYHSYGISMSYEVYEMQSLSFDTYQETFTAVFSCQNVSQYSASTLSASNISYTIRAYSGGFIYIDGCNISKFTITNTTTGLLSDSWYSSGSSSSTTSISLYRDSTSGARVWKLLVWGTSNATADYAESIIYCPSSTGTPIINNLVKGSNVNIGYTGSGLNMKLTISMTTSRGYGYICTRLR